MAAQVANLGSTGRATTFAWQLGRRHDDALTDAHPHATVKHLSHTI